MILRHEQLRRCYGSVTSLRDTVVYIGQVLVDGTWCRRRSAPSWRHGLEISAILAQHAVVEVCPLMVEAGDGDVTTGISLDEPIPPGGWAYLAPPAGASPAWS